MKILFDIKYRSQIESGEYKVETRDGRPARIICWDRDYTDRFCDYPVLALINEGEKECKEMVSGYTKNGVSYPDSENRPDDLFLITPEPELTEFEMATKATMTFGYDDNEEPFTNEEIRNQAKLLLDLAKKEVSV